MKQIFRAGAIIAIIATLFSFSTGGGEGFEVYLDKKLLLQQFGQQMKQVKTLRLDQAISEQQLVVRYHHCGRVGKNRVITIRDSRNKILKEWKYPNVEAASLATSGGAMPCKVKDIVSLQKANPGKLDLYYTSDEIPKGRMILSIVGSDLVKK